MAGAGCSTSRRAAPLSGFVLDPASDVPAPRPLARDPQVVDGGVVQVVREGERADRRGGSG
eukprot:787047-Alexandrium_andersonii.AAC.1